MIAATVFGAFVLSVRSSSNLLTELPIPTVTLQMVFASPTPTDARCHAIGHHRRSALRRPALHRPHPRRPFALIPPIGSATLWGRLIP